jgi:hypothetical protein
MTINALVLSLLVLADTGCGARTALLALGSEQGGLEAGLGSDGQVGMFGLCPISFPSDGGACSTAKRVACFYVPSLAMDASGPDFGQEWSCMNGGWMYLGSAGPCSLAGPCMNSWPSFSACIVSGGEQCCSCDPASDFLTKCGPC